MLLHDFWKFFSKEATDLSVLDEYMWNMAGLYVLMSFAFLGVFLGDLGAGIVIAGEEFLEKLLSLSFLGEGVGESQSVFVFLCGDSSFLSTRGESLGTLCVAVMVNFFSTESEICGGDGVVEGVVGVLTRHSWELRRSLGELERGGVELGRKRGDAGGVLEFVTRDNFS